MMKTMKIFLMTVILSSSAPVFAKTKATDFNDIIEQNNLAQKAMHSQIKQNLNETQAIVAGLKQERTEVVASESETINVPTNKNLLKFTKEKQRYQPSRAVNDKRLAQELEDMQ